MVKRIFRAISRCEELLKIDHPGSSQFELNRMPKKGAYAEEKVFRGGNIKQAGVTLKNHRIVKSVFVSNRGYPHVFIKPKEGRLALDVEGLRIAMAERGFAIKTDPRTDTTIHRITKDEKPIGVINILAANHWANSLEVAQKHAPEVLKIIFGKRPKSKETRLALLRRR